jgi:hypothetical protein
MIQQILLALAVAVLAVVMFVIIVWANVSQPAVKKIDCTWSEISPDFSPAMREACRKARQQ